MTKNNTVIKEIFVEEITMDYLQCLFYDTLAYNNIMQDILTLKREFKHNEETYTKFMNDTLDANRKFEFAKMEVIKQYIPEFEFKNNYTIDLFFAERRMTINENHEHEGGCTSCQCV